jgi:hypothetical protein
MLVSEIVLAFLILIYATVRSINLLNKLLQEGEYNNDFYLETAVSIFLAFLIVINVGIIFELIINNFGIR